MDSDFMEQLAYGVKLFLFSGIEPAVCTLKDQVNASLKRGWVFTISLKTVNSLKVVTAAIGKVNFFNDL
jgi:hypothetical protein